MKNQLVTSALALMLSTTASAAALNFTNGSGSYSVGGVTATVTATGGSLNYASGSGLGVKSNAFDFAGALGSGKSLTVTFNQAVNLNSVSFAQWDGTIDQVTMTYTSGSQTFSNAFFPNPSIDTFSTGGVLLTSFTLAPSAGNFSTSTYLNGLDVTAAVPVPAAAWLFGSGLLGLAGFSRRRAV